MLKPLLGGLTLTALLVSCAPTLQASTLGRIVNTGTGQEGTVTFLPGALRSRAGDTPGTNNVTFQVDGRTYVGRVVLVDVAATPSRPALNFSVGVGVSSGGNGGVGLSTQVGTAQPPRSQTRTGNLIARSQGPESPVTLTCTLQVDAGEHGVGDCTGSDGARYVVQF